MGKREKAPEGSRDVREADHEGPVGLNDSQERENPVRFWEATYLCCDFASPRSLFLFRADPARQSVDLPFTASRPRRRRGRQKFLKGITGGTIFKMFPLTNLLSNLD